MCSRFYFLGAAALALAGCNQASRSAALGDAASNPSYKQAEQDYDSNNPGAAVTDYEAALSADPKLADAHYKLGVIYGDKMNDPVSSIYHFKRYLELQPASEKKDQVQALIEKEGSVFAASVPSSGQGGQAADDTAKLQAENASLKQQVQDASHTITELQTQLSQRTATVAATSTPMPQTAPIVASADTAVAPGAATPAGTDPAGAAGASTPGPARALPVDQAAAAAGSADTDTTSTNGAPIDVTNARSYTVVKGDSYWKIAKKMYPGDTKNGVAKIQEANKQTMGKPLKIGQVLVIPK